MRNAGVDSYEFIAVLDNRTSMKCRSRDGEVYPLEEKSVGFNYPPLHPRCRSTVAPFIEGISRKGTRIAKDKSGKYIDIPAAMNYKDYESVYIRKEKSFETWKKERNSSSRVNLQSKQFKLPEGLAAADNTKYSGSTNTIIKLGKLTDSSLIKSTLEYFENQIINSNVENAIVITALNDVYYCVGDKNNITSILELGDKLNGAHVTHNHPLNSDNGYSFSNKDLNLFIEYELKILRGIDEKFVYELTRNPNSLDKMLSIAETDEFSYGTTWLLKERDNWA